MYIKIPLKRKVNDTILNKPITYKNKVVGVITHYDETYLYGVIWVVNSIKTEEKQDNETIFSELCLTDFWEAN